MMTSRIGTNDRGRRPGGASLAGRARGPLAGRGFTLIELLVVMSIIGVLVSLLLPAVNHTVIAVRAAACAHRIAGISGGLENFKSDWGTYPPSDPNAPDKIVGTDDTTNGTGGMQYGYQIMALALIGPTAKGWGAALGTGNNAQTPFGGSAPGRTYGPYYQMEAGGARSGIADAFPSPRRAILYFRFDPRNPVGQEFNHNDNPTTSSQGCPEEGFISKAHFDLSAKYETPDSRQKWQRDDYLLMSPGADRLYGYVREGDPPMAATDKRYINDGTATCDDITNF